MFGYVVIIVVQVWMRLGSSKSFVVVIVYCCVYTLVLPILMVALEFDVC